jgi:hypothetical protein
MGTSKGNGGTLRAAQGLAQPPPWDESLNFPEWGLAAAACGKG